MTTNIDVVKANVNLPQLILGDLGPPVHQTTKYWTWNCPLHDDREPSLVVYTASERGWWCFGCATGGDVFTWMEKVHKMNFKEALQRLGSNVLSLPAEELQRMADERRQQAEWHHQEAERKRQQAAQLLAEAGQHERWAEALSDDAEALDFLAAKGVSQAVAAHFHLGVRRDFYLGPALTIPWEVGGKLRNIQYRVINGANGQRYRWDERGAPATIWNADAVATGDGDLLIVEGAIKAMVLVQAGLEAVALASKSAWKAGWGHHFRHRSTYVALDPDADSEADQVARDIGDNARVVHLPAKPDDLLVKHGWSAEDLVWRMKRSRRPA